jgi:hypothetical protein
MTTPRYLPKVRNGAIAKRQARSKNPVTSMAFSSGAGIPRPRPNSRRVSNSARSRAGGGRRSGGRDARVIWLMILIGMALTVGFVFALRSQINAYKIAQAEEQLKMKLEEYAGKQKFLTLDQQRAFSAGESERAGRRNGLVHLKLDKEEAQDKASVRGMVSQVQSRVRAPQADQRSGLASDRQSGLRSIKGSVKTGIQTKAVRVVRTVKTGKAAKVVKVVKLNVAKREGAAHKAKANVVSTRKRQ